MTTVRYSNIRKTDDEFVGWVESPGGKAAIKVRYEEHKSIRLPAADIAKAKTIAERKGLRYQTYIKMLLHEALAKEAV